MFYFTSQIGYLVVIDFNVNRWLTVIPGRFIKIEGISIHERAKHIDNRRPLGY